MGKTNGIYHTASLKIYPDKLCRAIADAVSDAVGSFWNARDVCTEDSSTVDSWSKAILDNSNTLADMGMDRAGRGV